MPAITNCPSCQRPLQVPEEFLGTLVKCPACGATFTAAAPSAAAEPVEPAVAAQAPRDTEPSVGPRTGRPDDPEVRGVIASPAICLLLTGCLGLLCTAWCLAGVANGQLKLAIQQQPPQADPNARQLQQQMAEAAEGPAAFAMPVVFMAVNVLIILGAVAMLRRRWYALAVTASILAMVDQCCCLIGLPFGIWSLTVLSRPDVKAAFE